MFFRKKSSGSLYRTRDYSGNNATYEPVKSNYRKRRMPLVPVFLTAGAAILILAVLGIRNCGDSSPQFNFRSEKAAASLLPASPSPGHPLTGQKRRVTHTAATPALPVIPSPIVLPSPHIPKIIDMGTHVEIVAPR